MALEWSVPKIDGLRAAFEDSPEGLAAIAGQNNVDAMRPRAELTRALWHAAQQVPDAAMMLVKSEAGASIALLNGGLVIEGTAKVNLGLVRASTRNLEPQAPAFDPAQHRPSATRLRRSLWQILSRLNGAQMPRIYDFDIAGVRCQVQSEAGALRFAGELSDPARFVAALTKACETETEISYTLADKGADFGDTVFSSIDILMQVCDKSDDAAMEFDPDGWPLTCALAIDFSALQMLSQIAVAACAMSDQNGDLSLSVLSAANKPVLTGHTTADRSMLLVLS